MDSKLAIINAALMETGNNARQATDDGSCEGLISDANYRGLVEAELEDFPYSFARQSQFLTNRKPGNFGFPVGFQLPGQSLIVSRVFEQADKDCPPCGTSRYLPSPDWEEADCILYVDECKLIRRKGCAIDGIWAEFTDCSVPEARWSPNFKLGIKYRLAAIFARGINVETG